MRLFSRTFFSALLFSLGLLTPWLRLSAQTTALRLPPGVSYVTSVEGITEYRLANGLQVLLFPDPSKPIMTVNITYKVGSRHEDYGETGMAHLLEHLVFKGTPKHPNIPQELTEHGARPNGTTWFDRTNYYETFDATEENLRWALDLESDRMVNSFIAKKDLDSEFSVVRNEYERGENSPTGVLYKRMMGAVYQWHNYGKSTIGEKSDIEGAPIERLQAFYHKYYQPDNALLVVAGKIDEQKTLDMVNEYFSKIPKPTRQLIPTYTKEPTQDGERHITLRRTGDVQAFSAMYRTPAASHADYAALAILGDLLSDEPSGRLYKALVETKKAASVYGGVSGFAEGGYANFVCEVRMEQSISDAQTAMLAVLDGLKENTPSADEVEKSKTRLLKNWELFFKQSDRVGLSLSNYIGQGDWRLAFLYRDNLEKITVEDVARVALRYFKPANRTTGMFLPEKNPDRAEIPDAPNLAELLKDYKGKAAIAQGEDFDPTPANIESRTVRGKLANGMQYAMLSKKNRGNAVNATLTFRFGTLESLRNMDMVGGTAASMLDRGTLEKTRQQLQDLQDQLKARINVFGSASSVTVSIETDREHLAAAVQLAGEMLRKPAFPEAEFEKLREEYLSGIEQQKSEPSALANLAFNRITNPYPKGDPRYVMTFEEETEAAKAVKLDEVKAFYKKFYGASNATCAIVGDFDRPEMEKVLAETFGDWKSPAPYKRIEDNYIPIAAKTEVINTPDKANANLVAGYSFPMRNDHPDYPAITIGGYMLGGGFLNSRLATRIRQKEGLSYGVGGRFYASSMDENGGFTANAIYNPANVEKLEKAFREEIERASKEGFTSEEFEAAKAGWLKSQKVSRSGDATVASKLNQYLFIGRDMSWDADFENRVNKLTLPEVNAGIKKHLDYSKMIMVKAGDFNKVSKP
ncbi:MAG: insulinase family protein [Lewinellaceae bacterium]|nr:insulinase family protein [Lewinellaceae bacterium]